MYVQAALWYIVVKLSTVNVDIFSEYIFSHISCKVLGARKFDMSEEISRYRSILKGIELMFFIGLHQLSR